MGVRVLQGDCRDVSVAIAAILRYNVAMKSDGRIVKGQRLSPATEFKPGQHWRPHAKHRERAWLEQQYVTLGRSTGEIAKEIGHTDAAVLFWLKRHRIQRRSVSEARGIKYWGAIGAANPMYGKRGAASRAFIDGGSPERQRQYSRSEGMQFLAAIYARDNWTCVRCGTKKGGKRSLAAHHIVGWAGNPALRFDLENVISLCVPCHLWVHSKKNINRELLASARVKGDLG